MNEKLKIIGVSASARQNGMGVTLVKHVLNGAKELGAQVEMVDLYREQLKYCSGCLKCMELGKCVLNDNFEDIKQKLYKADGIVICAPTFCGTYSAVMKNFIDRLGLYERLTSSLGGKYVVGIATAGSQSSAKRTARSLVKILSSGTFSRGYVTGVIGASSRIDDELEVNHQKMKEKICIEAEEMGRNLVSDILNKKKYAFQNIINRLSTKWLIKPMCARFILKNREKSTKAAYQNLKARGFL